MKKWRTGASAAVNGPRVLTGMLDDYFDAGRKAARHKRSPKALHRFRLETKRFRYSLELFRPVYGPSLDRRMESLRTLQTALGKINDLQTILELLQPDPELESKLTRALKRKAKEFRKQWEAFDSANRLQQWKTFLANPPGAPGRRMLK